MKDESGIARDREAEAEDVVTALSDELRPSLLRYFRRKVRDTGHAEDLVQEVFLRLIKTPGFDGTSASAKGYVFQTAKNVHIDWLRRRKVRDAEIGGGVENDRGGDGEFTPERVLLGRERLEEATAALLELPERTRVIFVLRRIEGLKGKDVAKRLKISPSAVEKHMTRAIAHLMKRLDDA